MIDGVSRTDTFYRTTLPLAAPDPAAAFLFNLMGAWNDFPPARTIPRQKEMFVWTLGLRTIQGQRRNL